MISAPPVVVRSLVCHTAVEMAIAGLSSLAQFSDRPLTFVLHDDGSLQREDVERLTTALDARVISREEADDAAVPMLRHRPAAEGYRRRSPLGLKLIDIPLLSPGDLAYSDTDVLALRPFSGLFERPDEPSAMVFMGDIQNAYALRPWHLLGRAAIEVPARANTGIVLMRADAYDLDFVEWVLARNYEVYRRIPGWVEQTCWAALGQRAGCHLYDDVQVRVIRSDRCLSDPRMVIGHFTSSVRGLWHQGLATVTSASPRCAITTRASRPLGAINLAGDHARRAVARFRRRTVS